MIDNYLDSMKARFGYYKNLIEKTMDQLSDSDLHWQYDEHSNSIMVIINHLTGNMLSRWTDFLTTDGEKEWRNRDREFEKIIKTREELNRRLEEGWSVLFGAIDSIHVANFDTKVFIRNEEHTIIEAINRQLAHYAYHIGQIVFIGKMIKGESWQTLSIAKGKSEEYNREL